MTKQKIAEDLRNYTEQGSKIYEKLGSMDADADTQGLASALDGIRTRVSTILSQVEESIVALKKVKVFQQQQQHEVSTYKIFLEDTDNWLQNIIASINQQHSIDSYKVRLLALYSS